MFCSPEPPPLLGRREWFLLVAGLAFRAAHAGELRRVPDADKSARDPSLESLLRRIQKLVDTRDYRGIEALMLPNFRVEFDAGQGPRAFRKYWRSDSEDSPLWEVLRRLMALGGTFLSDSLFVLPYVYARFPIDMDLLGYVVAVNKDTALLSDPARGAARVGTLERSVVPLAKRLEPPVRIPVESFVELEHPQIGRCFVSASDVYSPAAHRAFFEKRGGEWKWISLAAATLADPPVLRKRKRNM